MIKTLIKEFPVSTVIKKDKINSYTKEEVDSLIDAAVDRAVAEARRRLTEVEALLVVEGDLLVGLVSRMDLVRALRLNSIA